MSSDDGHIMRDANSKLEELKKKRESLLERLNAKIADAQRVEDSRQRKEDARHKIIVGACLLADIETHPELRSLVEQSLKRIATERDLEFLKVKGWRL